MASSSALRASPNPGFYVLSSPDAAVQALAPHCLKAHSPKTQNIKATTRSKLAFRTFGSKIRNGEYGFKTKNWHWVKVQISYGNGGNSAAASRL